MRSGDPKDVERLLLAGYYHQALADREAGRHEQAATLIAQAAGSVSAATSRCRYSRRSRCCWIGRIQGGHRRR